MDHLRIVSVGLLFVSFGLVSAADDKSPPEGWKEFTGGFKQRSYAFWLPKEAETKDSENSLVAPKYGQIRIFRTVCKLKDGPQYAAGEIILPPDLTKATPKVRQDFFRDLFLDEVKGKLVEEKKVESETMPGYLAPGKEYLIETPDGMARYRLMGGGVKIYRVVAIGTKEQMKSKDVDIFFDSFKRTPMEDKKDK